MEEQNILSWNLKELWNYIRTIEDELEDYIIKQIKVAKNGIEYEFPIQYILKEYIEIYPSSRRVKILGFGKIPIQDYWEEVEAREKILRKIALDYNEGDEIITARD